MAEEAGNTGAQALSSTPAGPRHERVALGVVVVSLALFAALAPFAKLQLERLPAFIPLYQAALVVIDLVTAALLFAQWRVVRTRPLYVLACGYLFTGLMIVAHTLSFPGLFAPQGVIGGGAHTTAWLYMFWHALFPVFVGAYAVARPAVLSRVQAAAGVAVTVALAGAFALLAGAGERLLPEIMAGNNYLPAYHMVVGLTWLCSVAGLALVWRKRPRTVLDVWAMVVLTVWICEIALAAVLNAGRFDLGFYAGRIYGLAAASFLLCLFIYESSRMYERAAAATAEREARAAAQAASQAKDQFLAVLGHELRNPLAPIVTSLQIMRMRDPNALADERLVIERQVEHLRRLVDDLLDISRLTRGSVELRRTRCEAADIVARAHEMAAPLIEKRRHQLELDVPRTGLALDADGDRLAQALCNLLVNAAKFTAPGGRIRVSAAREGAEVVLRVRDNGAGIPRELMQRLFQPFSQGPQSYERAEGGLGLGLAIAKNLAALHGGRVEAASEGPGRGAEFALRLPAVLDAQAGPARGTRVLIVDDNPDAAETLAQALRLHGLEVRTAHSGGEALEIAAAWKPHTAILDLGLPGMNGLQLAARLRKLPGCGGLALAALTGYGQRSDRALTASAGFAAHFVKPVQAEALLFFLGAAVPAARA